MSSSDTLSNEGVSSLPTVKVGILVSAIGIGIFMSTLDATIVVIILEKIKSYYGVTSNRVQWVILAYLLVMMAFTVIAGDLGDKFSNKLVFQIGMVVFALGSLFCFLASRPALILSNSFWWLVLGRAIQAIGATGMIANGMALITCFTTKKNRGTAVGINNLLISISVVIGPVLGAVISDSFLNWGGIFIINV
ncbi:MAG: MFS transporter, partial [Candidatus Heimdallarchaeota archaeon]|nr:MFS transporter [Candidatus Heimdallarchaeota archaeon]MCK4876493.1 MFS transporter [Candidatus Heimdallarchaeota archaeon]